LKVGINKWQEIQHRDLQRAKELSDVEGDWWQVALSFEEVSPSPGLADDANLQGRFRNNEITL